MNPTLTQVAREQNYPLETLWTGGAGVRVADVDALTRLKIVEESILSFDTLHELCGYHRLSLELEDYNWSPRVAEAVALLWEREGGGDGGPPLLMGGDPEIWLLFAHTVGEKGELRFPGVIVQDFVARFVARKVAQRLGVPVRAVGNVRSVPYSDGRRLISFCNQPLSRVRDLSDHFMAARAVLLDDEGCERLLRTPGWGARESHRRRTMVTAPPRIFYSPPAHYLLPGAIHLLSKGQEGTLYSLGGRQYLFEPRGEGEWVESMVDYYRSGPLEYRLCDVGGEKQPFPYENAPRGGGMPVIRPPVVMRAEESEVERALGGSLVPWGQVRLRGGRANLPSHPGAREIFIRRLQRMQGAEEVTVGEDGWLNNVALRVVPGQAGGVELAEAEAVWAAAEARLATHFTPGLLLQRTGDPMWAFWPVTVQQTDWALLQLMCRELSDEFFPWEARRGRRATVRLCNHLPLLLWPPETPLTGDEGDHRLPVALLSQQLSAAVAQAALDSMVEGEGGWSAELVQLLLPEDWEGGLPKMDCTARRCIIQLSTEDNVRILEGVRFPKDGGEEWVLVVERRGEQLRLHTVRWVPVPLALRGLPPAQRPMVRAQAETVDMGAVPAALGTHGIFVRDFGGVVWGVEEQGAGKAEMEVVMEEAMEPFGEMEWTVAEPEIGEWVPTLPPPPPPPPAGERGWDLVAVRGSCGSGKTTAAGRHVAECVQRGYRCVVVTPRDALVRQFLASLGGGEWVRAYDGRGEQPPDANCAVTTIHSLHKLLGNFVSPDGGEVVLIIDEAHTTFVTDFCTHVMPHGNVMAALCHLLLGVTRQVVLMDAHMPVELVASFAALLPVAVRRYAVGGHDARAAICVRQVQAQRSSVRVQGREALLMTAWDAKQHATLMIRQHLAEGKRVAVFFGSVNALELWRERMWAGDWTLKDRTLTFTSRERKPVAELSAKIARDHVRLFLFTTVAGAGVDVEFGELLGEQRSRWFTGGTFLFASEPHCTGLAMMQAMSRVRDQPSVVVVLPRARFIPATKALLDERWTETMMHTPTALTRRLLSAAERKAKLREWVKSFPSHHEEAESAVWDVGAFRPVQVPRPAEGLSDPLTFWLAMGRASCMAMVIRDSTVVSILANAGYRVRLMTKASENGEAVRQEEMSQLELELRRYEEQYGEVGEEMLKESNSARRALGLPEIGVDEYFRPVEDCILQLGRRGDGGATWRALKAYAELAVDTVPPAQGGAEWWGRLLQRAEALVGEAAAARRGDERLGEGETDLVESALLRRQEALRALGLFAALRASGCTLTGAEAIFPQDLVPQREPLQFPLPLLTAIVAGDEWAFTRDAEAWAVDATEALRTMHSPLFLPNTASRFQKLKTLSHRVYVWLTQEWLGIRYKFRNCGIDKGKGTCEGGDAAVYRLLLGHPLPEDQQKEAAMRVPRPQPAGGEPPGSPALAGARYGRKKRRLATLASQQANEADFDQGE